MVHFRFYSINSTNSMNFFLEHSQKTSFFKLFSMHLMTCNEFHSSFISFAVIFFSKSDQYFVWICFGMDQFKSSYFGIRWTYAARRRCHGSRATVLGYVAICHIRRGGNYYLLLHRRFHWTKTTSLVGSCSARSKSTRSLLFASWNITDSSCWLRNSLNLV